MKNMGESIPTELSHAGHRRRLRDRFEKSGLEGFADYEVVELPLTLAIPRSDVKQPAKELIARFGTLRDDQVAEVVRRITTFPQKNLIENNRQVLRYLLENTTVSVNHDTGEQSPTVRFVDFC